MSKPKQSVFKRDLFFLILFFIPLVAAIIWSVEPSIRSFLGAYKLNKIEAYPTSLTDPDSVKKIKRNIQMHFLDYDVYIPLEDIIMMDKGINNKMFNELMEDVCGKAELYIWLPLPIRLPIIQSKTFEYCWKPKIVHK